jgi:hypothetical protein
MHGNSQGRDRPDLSAVGVMAERIASLRKWAGRPDSAGQLAPRVYRAKSASTFAAQMKSFSLIPLIAWVM